MLYLYLVGCLSMYGILTILVERGEMFRHDKKFVVVLWPLLVMGLVGAGVIVTFYKVWEKLPFFMKKTGHD